MTPYRITPEPYTGSFLTLKYRIAKENDPGGFGIVPAIESINDWRNRFTGFAAAIDPFTELFETEYAEREISAETPDEWMANAKGHMIRLLYRYDLPLRMEQSSDYHPERMADQVTLGTHSRTGHETHKGKARHESTPFSQTDGDTYLTSRNSTDGEGWQTETAEDGSTVRSGSDLDKVNAAADAGRGIVPRMVDDCSILFMSRLVTDWIL